MDESVQPGGCAPAISASPVLSELAAYQPAPVQVSLPITLELLRDIAITACEGGIGYWSACEVYQWREPLAAAKAAGRVPQVTQHPEPDYVELPFPVVVLVPNSDDPDEVFEEGVPKIMLAPATVRNGIEKYITKQHTERVGSLIKAIQENDAGYIDASMADDIIQYGIFGELRYS